MTRHRRQIRRLLAGRKSKVEGSILLAPRLRLPSMIEKLPAGHARSNQHLGRPQLVLIVRTFGACRFIDRALARQCFKMFRDL
jgi:hypothetical protein